DIKNDLAEYFRADAYFKSQLMNAMDKMQGTEEQQNALLTEILEAIKTLGTDNKNYYLGIINEMSKNGAKMDDVIALLKTINENVVKGNKQNKEYGDAIIALLAKLGDSSAATLNAILKNGTKLDDILAILKVINGNVVDGNKITENYGKQILEAIKTGNGKLDDIKKLVEHIDNDIHEFKENAQKMGEAIIEAINKKKCGGSIDMTAILNKLDEILAAIKDHKVDVTVDVTGKVECNCNCGSKHEGILGELNSMIN
ncbi:hypothetical protein IKQ21_03365, partial [bacterium]|nr:hypothetical protein [bacterium]